MDLERLAGIFDACKALPLRPDDLLVFRAGGDRVLSLSEKAELHTALEQLTGHTRIVILDGGADLAVLRPEPEPAEPQRAAAAPAGAEILPNGRAKVGTAPGALA